MKTILIQADIHKNGKVETGYMVDIDLTRETYTITELEDMYEAMGKAIEKARSVENLLKRKELKNE